MLASSYRQPANPGSAAPVSAGEKRDQFERLSRKPVSHIKFIFEGPAHQESRWGSKRRYSRRCAF